MSCIEFLKFCLDDKRVVPVNVNSIDWRKMLVWAEQQAIVGVIFQGIQRGGKSLEIPTEILFRWIGRVQQIEMQNRLLNKRCVEIASEIATVGLESCVLKGQANAQMYPHPLSRTAGDIDLLVLGNREEVTRKVKEKYPHVHENYIHIDYPAFSDVSVELHFLPSYANNPIYNRRIQKWFKEQGNTFIEYVELSDGVGKIPVASVKFNIVYQLMHMMHHFFDEGIGLRQMIDYYFLLKSGNNNQVHGSKLMVNGSTENMKETLKYLNLYKFAGAVMYIMKEMLGLDEKYLIVPIDERRGKTLLKEILEGGNFGHYSNLDQNNAAKKYFQKTWRNMHLVKEYPAEALCEPIFRTWHFFWRMAH